MGNLNANAQGDLALGSVSVVGGTPSFAMNRGFTNAIVDNGPGDYTLTLKDEQNLVTQGIVSVTPRGSAPLESAVEIVNTSEIRVRFLDNTGAPADTDFWIRVTPVSPQ